MATACASTSCSSSSSQAAMDAMVSHDAYRVYDANVESLQFVPIAPAASLAHVAPPPPPAPCVDTPASVHGVGDDGDDGNDGDELDEHGDDAFQELFQEPPQKRRRTVRTRSPRCARLHTRTHTQSRLRCAPSCVCMQASPTKTAKRACASCRAAIPRTVTASQLHACASCDGLVCLPCERDRAAWWSHCAGCGVGYCAECVKSEYFDPRDACVWTHCAAWFCGDCATQRTRYSCAACHELACDAHAHADDSGDGRTCRLCADNETSYRLMHSEHLCIRAALLPFCAHERL